MGQPSKESKDKWLQNNHHKRTKINRDWKLRAVYGISPEEYKEMIVQQGNQCAICKKEFGEEHTKQGPHIDHNHESRWVRGLLCGNCNTGVGMFGDNIDFLQNAIEYLILNNTPTEFFFTPLPNPKRTHSAEWRLAASKRQKGNTYRRGLSAWNKGLKWSEDIKIKMRKPHKTGGNDGQ